MESQEHRFLCNNRLIFKRWRLITIFKNLAWAKQITSVGWIGLWVSNSQFQKVDADRARYPGAEMFRGSHAKHHG